jgi:hypothetical protein
MSLQACEAGSFLSMKASVEADSQSSPQELAEDHNGSVSPRMLACEGEAQRNS